MKTSTVLASFLFGSLAVAAPLDKRARVTKTEIITEIVTVYTTVYGDAPAATSSEGLFYEQPSSATASPTSAAPSAAAASSAAAAPYSSAPEAPEVPVSTYVAPVVQASPAPAPEPSTSLAPEPAPAPEPVTSSVAEPAPEPEPVTSSVAEPAPAPAPTAAPTPEPVASSAPAAPAAPAPQTQSSGEEYTNVDMTVYDTADGYGACGEQIHDSEYIVALAYTAFGPTTYDTMTGATTNSWCKKMITISYNGNSVTAKVMDKCPGCAGANDIDVSRAVWKALGMTEDTRVKASWSSA